MARRKFAEEHVNHERWLVSYADFITLLFAFFVVMYSISSVNEGKYRVMAESINAAFRDPLKTLNPIQVGELARSPEDINNMIIELEKQKEKIEQEQKKTQPKDIEMESDKDTFQKISDEVTESLAYWIDNDQVTVNLNEKWVEVEIRTSLLFKVGQANMGKEAQEVIKELSLSLKGIPNHVHVEGFSDNLPIKTRRYPSNWELSAARAASVVRLLVKQGVDPSRLAAVGYGEYRPIASNDTAEGRNKNRRVAVVIFAGDDTRAKIDKEKQQQ